MTSDPLTVTSIQSATRPIPELPNEIFLLIIQRCPGATQKQLRLVSRTLAQMTEPFLWRKVVLIPNDHCILAFIKALKRSKVLRHVVKLTYDGRFAAFFTRIKDVTPKPSESFPHAERAKELASLDRTYQGHFKPYEDVSIEVACLAKALRLLPNLKRVCVREYEDDITCSARGRLNRICGLKVPSFYLKICKRLRVDPEDVGWSTMFGVSGRSYTKGFLTAAFSADCRLQKLKAKSVDGRAIFGVVPMKTPSAYQQVSIFKNIMDGLRELELSFRNDTLVSNANHIEAVGQLLKAAKRLKKLRLRLTDCSTNRYHYSSEDLMSDFAGLVETSTGTWLCKPLVPKLETLMIDACICHDEDLMHFLKLHSGTLRQLELSNITLLGGDDRRECWVRLIKHLKTELKLASISFSGWFSNGGRQQWSVAKDTVGIERLKAKVENYVVDRRIRDCPLEPVAIKPNEADVEKPANGEEFEGDLTWTMVYSHRYADHADWVPTEPSFGVNPHAPLEISPTPPSESGSWAEIGDGQDVYADAFADPSAAAVPKVEVLIDVGAGTTEFQTWKVLSTSSMKTGEASPSGPAATWTWTPTSPSFMA